MAGLIVGLGSQRYYARILHATLNIKTLFVNNEGNSLVRQTRLASIQKTVGIFLHLFFFLKKDAAQSTTL